MANGCNIAITRIGPIQLSSECQGPQAGFHSLLIVGHPQVRVFRLGLLQAGIAAALNWGRPIRRNRSWKRGLSRKASMLGSI
jgi:hypothetical protein